jgi:hypothetical protein
MSLDPYLTKLREMARLRSISIDANGIMDVRPLPDEGIHGDLSLDLQVDPTLLAPVSQCLGFEATTIKFVLPLALDVAGPMIDPLRWGEFSEIKTSAAKKHRVGSAGDWTGTIEERVRVKVGPIVTSYHNRLKIDFHIRPDKSRVDFELDECFQGDLAFERGFFEVEPHAFLPVVTLVSSKSLLYKPPSPWCQLPEPVLVGILVAWLHAATAEYALRMALLGAGESPLGLDSGLIDELLRTLRND